MRWEEAYHHPAMPTSLLNLSRELRDLIYGHVFDTSLTPPQTEDDLNDTQTTLDRQNERTGSCPVSCALPVQITTAPLLLVNRQIHSEFTQIIALETKKRGLRYKLDCLILCEEEIHLTWLCVPAMSPYVAVLEVGIRMYGDGDGWYSAWQQGDSISCRIAKSLYSVLIQFLKCGPGFRKSKCRGVAVGVLVLDVMTPVSLNLGYFVPGEGSSQDGEEADPYLQWQNEVRTSPEAVVGKLEDGIVGLFGFSRSYWDLLYKRIGVISIRLDGEERSAFDLRAKALKRT